MGTFDGLGVPLCGAYSCYLPNGTTSYLEVDTSGIFNFTANTTTDFAPAAVAMWLEVKAAGVSKWIALYASCTS
jgi:hypothetical protein